MSATRWYVRSDWYPSRELGTVVTESIDVALTLARVRWGHDVVVSNMPKSPQPCVITYHSPSVVQELVAATPDVDLAGASRSRSPREEKR